MRGPGLSDKPFLEGLDPFKYHLLEGTTGLPATPVCVLALWGVCICGPFCSHHLPALLNSRLRRCGNCIPFLLPSPLGLAQGSCTENTCCLINKPNSSAELRAQCPGHQSPLLHGCTFGDPAGESALTVDPAGLSQTASVSWSFRETRRRRALCSGA